MMNDEAFQLVQKSLHQKGQPLHSPVTPTPEEVADLYRERITPERELPPMQPLFRMFDTPCFYRGELVADCGKAKSGKTTFLSVLMACAIGNQKILNLERQTEPSPLPPLRVLWIDTEQSQQSTQEILKQRIIPLVSGDTDSPDINDTIYAFNFRGMGYEARKKMVGVAIRAVEPDLVIIDGIKDLMTDINDAVQATLIMEQLMALAKEQNCCIVCVLHLNKSEADRNMRGSIGTELTNKAFEVFQCEIVEDSDTFKVTQTYSRKQKMKQRLYYRLSDDGMPIECPGYKERPRDAQGRWVSMSTSSTPEADLQKLFITAMEGRTQRPFGEVMAVALKKCGIVDAKAYYACLDQAVELGIVRKELHPDTGATWVVLVDNALPF